MGTEATPPRDPVMEPVWETDEDDLREELQKKKENEWRKLAEDLKIKRYLAVDTDIEEFLTECRTFVSDEVIGFLILRASKQVLAPFSTMLLASAVLAREATDQNVPFAELCELEKFLYPNSPTKTQGELYNDVGELAAWVAGVLDQRPQRLRRQDVNKQMIEVLVPRLSELAIMCYCKARGWTPLFKKLDVVPSPPDLDD